MAGAGGMKGVQAVCITGVALIVAVLLFSGAAGFIGMHLVERLLAQAEVGGAGLPPENIIAIDAYTPFYSTWLKLARAAWKDRELSSDDVGVRSMGLESVMNVSCCDEPRMCFLLETHSGKGKVMNVSCCDEPRMKALLETQGNTSVFFHLAAQTQGNTSVFFHLAAQEE
ncbi:hypothetical protein T484DRAFT_1773332 [Baffinella frigidus]|nr:hypothetical protein T484DRAFT_1773332 [Cryptophyta sp. CCMP2293]